MIAKTFPINRELSVSYKITAKVIKSTFDDGKCNLQWYCAFIKVPNNNSQLLGHRSYALQVSSECTQWVSSAAAFSSLLFHLVLIETISLAQLFFSFVALLRSSVNAMYTIITGFRLHLCKRVECVYFGSVANKLDQDDQYNQRKRRWKWERKKANERADVKQLFCANVCKLLL